jgi:energy-coupling factor transporter ATP-binding protein EcfA2
MSWPAPIAEAMAQRPGAVFRRCALQVNPFAYVQRQSRATSFADEADYNAAMVGACREEGIEVVGLTDHHTVATSRGLHAALTAAGVVVFPGFEVCTSDGVHALALFEPDTTERELERRLGSIGATDPGDPNGLADKNLRELLDLDWPAAIIAPHVTYDDGILKHLRTGTRQETWRHSKLLAAGIPCTPKDVNDRAIRDILLGRDPEYDREHPIALLYANDVNGPTDLGKQNTTTYLKMTAPTVEGLKAAFRDPGSRVRLPGADEPEDRTELVAASWTGGFLDGSSLRFNGNLNVLIGGRGVGKSTLIESLRYALELQPIGTAGRIHQEVIDKVLGAGSVVRVLVSSPWPSPKQYLIERAVPRSAVVLDEDGRDTNLMPHDVLPNVAVWGQHELGELEEHPERRSTLVDRFAVADATLTSRQDSVSAELAKNGKRLTEVENALESVRQKLAGVPALEEQQRRYASAGVEDRLQEQSQDVREDRLFGLAQERLGSLRELEEPLRDAARPDRAFLSDAAIGNLPDADLLREAERALAAFESEAAPLVDGLRVAMDSAATALQDIRRRWRERRDAKQAAFDARLRELQAEHIDTQEFLALQKRLQELLPLRERAERLEHEQTQLLQERASLLTEWHDIRHTEHDALDKAATYVTRRLKDAVRVSVAENGDTTALEQLLRDRVGGRLDQVVKAVGGGVDPVEFATWCREDPEALAARLGITPKQAQSVCGATRTALREIEELDLPSLTMIELNVGTSQSPVWRAFDDLSKGQKATAALLLLLLGEERAGPLVVDQPEDDLDNKFIFETIVPAMRQEKRHRQFLFATHDPNIPVLGDAELIAELSTESVGADGRTSIKGRIGADGRLGSIDVLRVREAVEENLEGGQEAFERRRRMYGF